MAIITCNWIGSKFHLCCLFTACVFHIWTEDSSPWCTVYYKRVQSGDEFLVLQREEIYISYIRWKKILPILKLKNGLLDLRQDISAQKMKTIQEGHLWSPCLKMLMLCTTWTYRTENFSQKDISGTCRVHHPWCVGHDEPLYQMGAKKLECRSEVWSHCGFTDNSWALQMEHNRLLGSSCDNGWNMDIFLWPRDKITIWGVETQWFTMPKKVSNTEVSIQGDGICFVGQRWDTAGWLLWKECYNHRQLWHPSLAEVKQRGSCQKEHCFSRTKLPTHSCHHTT